MISRNGLIFEAWLSNSFFEVREEYHKKLMKKLGSRHRLLTEPRGFSVGRNKKTGQIPEPSPSFHKKLDPNQQGRGTVEKKPNKFTLNKLECFKQAAIVALNTISME